MATTTPDNLFSPDPTSPYNLVADLSTSMTSVQAALVRRANSYVGTSAQRLAFTTAPEGVQWRDTDGTKKEYVRQAGAWVDINPDTGWVNVTVSASGWIVQGSQPLAARVKDGVVYFKGLLSNDSFSGGFTTIATLPASIPRPPTGYYMFSLGANSAVNHAARVLADGSVQVYRASAGGTFFSFSPITYPEG